MSDFSPHYKPIGLMLSVFLLMIISLASCSNVNQNESIYPDAYRESLTLLDTCPGENQENISTEAVVKLLFNKPLKPETINQSSVILGSGRWLVRGSVFYDDRLITYIPNHPLDPKSRYALYITSDIRDEDGFALTDDVLIFTFDTGNSFGITCR